MIFRHERNGVTWIDLENPSGEEVREAATSLGIESRIAEELASPSPLPLVFSEGTATLLTLHFPIRESKGDITNQEIDIVVGKDGIITASYEVVAPLHKLRKILETDAALTTHTFTPDALVELIFTHLFGSIRDYANHIADRLTRIEHDMFSGKERATVRPISEISRQFLHLEAATANQEQSLALFLEELERRNFFVAEKARPARILAARLQVARLVETFRAITTELRETNAALLSSTQNEIMKTLTVVTFIMLPLALVANVFEMNLPGVPFSDNPHAFWIIVSLMFAVSGILVLFFTRKRWL